MSVMKIEELKEEEVKRKREFLKSRHLNEVIYK